MKYLKILKEWFSQKVKIHEKYSIIFFKERQIWMTNLGINIGHEQNGGGKNFGRPCLVLKKLGPSTAIIIPLTSQEKHNIFRIEIELKSKKSFLQLDQIRTVSTQRFNYKMKSLSKNEFMSIQKSVIELLLQ